MFEIVIAVLFSVERSKNLIQRYHKEDLTWHLV
jgi:hypothetical protein